MEETPRVRSDENSDEAAGHAYAIKGEITVHFSISSDTSVAHYPDTLLVLCGSLIDQDHLGLSVVVAHMACEVATERCLSLGLEKRGVDDVREQLLGLFNGYSLTNPRHKNVYVALTGDKIDKCAFWERYKRSTTRRNNAVHRGTNPDKNAAKKTHEMAIEFVAHVQQVEKQLVAL